MLYKAKDKWKIRGNPRHNNNTNPVCIVGNNLNVV